MNDEMSCWLQSSGGGRCRAKWSWWCESDEQLCDEMVNEQIFNGDHQFYDVYMGHWNGERECPEHRFWLEKNLNEKLDWYDNLLRSFAFVPLSGKCRNTMNKDKTWSLWYWSTSRCYCNEKYCAFLLDRTPVLVVLTETEGAMWRRENDWSWQGICAVLLSVGHILVKHDRRASRGIFCWETWRFENNLAIWTEDNAG